MNLATMLIRFDYFSVLTYICVFVGTLCFLVYLKVFRRDAQHVRFARKIPGPPSIPIIGHGFDFFWSGYDGTEKLLKYSQKYGSLYRLWFGKHLALVMSSAEEVQSVFLSSKMLDKPDMCRAFFEHFGNSLFSQPLHMWKKHRKQIQPLFGRSALHHYEATMNSVIYKYMKKLDKMVDGPEFDVWNYVPFLVFDVVTKTSFDVELNNEEKNKLQFHLCIKKMAESMFLKSVRPWLHVKLFRRFLSWLQGVDATIERVQKFASKIAEEKLPELKQDLLESDVNTYPQFLSTVYKLQEEYDDMKIMHDQMVILCAAATDTTAIVICFLLLALAMHPEVQDRLWSEINEVYADDSREANIDDLNKLPYLEQVIKETQRRFTPLALLFRKVEEDSKIGNLTIPAGTALLINIMAIHNSNAYYKDPSKFDPDRFTPEEIEKRAKLSYIPFSAGVRNCVGLNYAMLVIKLATVAFLRAYKFETSMKLEDVKLNIGFITTSVDGYKVSIQRRSK